MKILLINHYAGSVYHGMEFRPYYLAREWVKMGHEVIIIAASYSHLRQKNITMTSELQEEIIDGIKYVWLRTPKYSGNGVGRVKNMAAFIYKLYRYLPSITAMFKPDAVIASSTYPLDSYPANWIAKKHGAKFVFELHDLWPMSPMVLGHMSKWHPFIWIMQRGEDYWCRNADVVISLLPDADIHLKTRGMEQRKFHILSNGVCLDEWQATGDYLPEEYSRILEEQKKNDKFLVGYVGGHSVSNGLDFLLDAAKDVAYKEPRVHFIFVGDGAAKNHLVRRAKEEEICNVSFLSPLSKKLVPVFLKHMDLLTCCFPDTPLAQYGMSLNKIYDYMMSSKPVLWSANVSNNIIEEAHCGFTIPVGDMLAYNNKMMQITRMPCVELKALGENGKNYIKDKLTYNVISQEFINYME